MRASRRHRRLAPALAAGVAARRWRSPCRPAAPAHRPSRRGERAEQARAALFAAQTALLLDEPAGRSIGRARAALGARCAGPGRRRPRGATAPRARPSTMPPRPSLPATRRALAAARGEIVAALRRGAYAVDAGRRPRRRRRTRPAWLLVRDFREATRFTRPGVDATAAIDDLAAGELEPDDAATQVKKDLLDAYQARLGDYLVEAERRGRAGLRARAGRVGRAGPRLLAGALRRVRQAARRARARKRHGPRVRRAGERGPRRRRARVRCGARRRFASASTASRPRRSRPRSRRAAPRS